MTLPASPSPREHVFVALSGGVDSAVAALRLKAAGTRVSALFMKNWEEDDSEGYCASAADLEDARRVCDRLDLPLHTVNFCYEYWDRVFTRFVREYREGRTPNPDVLCNREIKFQVFAEHAKDLGATHIATGHYVRVLRSGGLCRLLKGLDEGKDQSYFLHTLTQAQLEGSLFPLGEMRKPEVRRLAREAGLPPCDKQDSTGICFIGERPFRRFLERYVSPAPGPILGVDGETLGRHHGLAYYTIGQRQGLGIGGRSGDSGAPWYVYGKDLERNQLRVVQGREHPALYSREVLAGPVHWIAGPSPRLPLRCRAKVRYRQADQACEVHPEGDGRIRVRFDTGQWAVAPGQSIVLYQGEECLGGAVIEGPLRPPAQRSPACGCVDVRAGEAGSRGR